MSNLVILDDSVTAFTDPTQLQGVYGTFWNEGLPTTIAIAPMALGTSGIPSIPLAKQDTNGRSRISENKTLCDYLGVMAEQRLVEICQYGFHGTDNEFATEDDLLLQQKIEEGQAELQRAFPDVDSQTVCVPPRHISQIAIQLLSEYNFNIVAFNDNANSVQHRQALNDSRALFYYGDRFFSQANASPAEKVIKQLETSDYVILRMSYTTFFDANTPTPVLTEWQAFCKAILAVRDITIDTIAYI
ncbi:MAG: hypothetical protein AAFV98_22785 [Chloroflexota bacterium]